MSKTIDERVVEMRFDNSKFESGAKTTMSTLEKLKQALKFDKASEGFENISKAASNIKLDGIGAACETVSAKFSAMQVVAYTALSRMTEDAIDAAKKIANALTLQGAKDGFTEYELKMGSVQTIMNSTGEDLQTVMKQLEELNKYADQTIYSFSDMTSNIGKFTNAGVKLEDAVAAIKGVSNEAAVSGANAQEASRAMYNFAQALSAGYVKLIDWKSIENANMATVEFKNELIKTALELGTITKEEEMFKTVTTDAKGKISEAFDATHAFNESLSHQWMTTEVLTKTLAKYSDENTDLGKKAYAAAQDVKTFSMMIDTLKEAIGSGWAVTWEKLIGDFNQAKDFFTEATNTLSEVISAQADARNEFIDAVMNRGDGLKDVNDWVKLAGTIRMAGGDVGQFKDIIVDTARANGVAIDEMIAKAGSFNDTLAEGWLSPKIMNQAIAKAQALGELSPEFSGLAKAVSLTNKPFRDLNDEINEVSGRTHVINTLRNVFEALKTVITPIKDAFREIFPPKTADDVRGILKAIDNFTKGLILSDESASRVKETFRGFFNLISQGLGVIKSIAEAFSPLKDIFKILFINVLDGIEGLGKFFNTLGQGESEVSLFQTILKAVHDTLQSFADNLQTYIDNAKEALSTLKNMLSESWNTGALSNVAAIVEKIRDVLAGFTNGLSNGFKHFFDILAGIKFDGSGIQKIVNVLEVFGEGLGKVLHLLGSFIEPIINKLKTFFSEVSIIDATASAIKAGGMASAVGFLYKIIDNIGDMKSVLENIVKSIQENNPLLIMGNFFQSLGDTLEGLEYKFKSDTLTNFAISIGILAASIYVLASIDAKGAERAVTIVSAVLGELVGVFVLINKLNSQSGDLKFFDVLKKSFAQLAGAQSLNMMATALIKMAAAVLILAVSMKMIADIDTVSLIKSFAVVSALLWELVGVTKVLQSNEKMMISGAGAMTKLAVSVLILAEALKIIASIDSSKLLSSFLVLSGVITELTLFMAILSGNDKVRGGATLLALAVSITILAGALKIFETMSWADIGKGLATLAGLLIELGVAMKFMQSNIGAAASLLVAAVAITILVGALKILETISADKILPILGLLGGVLAELALDLTLMIAALPGAAALVVASAALLVLAGALKVMSTISSEKVGPLLLIIGGILAELALGLTLMIAALPGAAALIVAAAAIAILVPALVALAAIPAKKIWTAIGQIAVALLAFGAVGAVLGLVSPLILSFGAALVVLGAGLAAIGAAIALAGIGFAAFATALGVVCEVGAEAAEILVDALGKIIEKLLTFAPRIGVAVGQSIIAVLQTIGQLLPEVKSVVSKVLDMVIDLIREYIPKIVTLVGDLIVQILESARTYIPQIVDLVLETVTGVINAVAENLPNIIEAGANLIVGFLQGIQENIGRVIDEAFKTVIAFINGLADAVRNNGQEIFDAAMNLISAFIEAIIACIASLGSKLLGGGRDIISKIWSGFSSLIKDTIENVAQFVEDMLDKIGEYAGKFWDLGKKLMSKLGEGLMSITGVDMIDTDRVMQSVIEGFGGSFDEYKRILEKEGQEAANAYVEGLKSDAGFDINSPSKRTKEVGMYALEGLRKGLEEGSDDVIAKGGKLAGDIISNMIGAITGHSASLSDKTTDTVSKIGGVISKNVGSIKGPFDEIFSSLVKTVKDNQKPITDNVKQLIDMIISTIKSYYSKFIEEGQALLTRFIEGMRSKSTITKGMWAGLLQEIINTMRAQYGSFVTAGVYLVEGFVKGMQSKVSSAAVAAAEMAKAATKAARTALDINSPSKVFAQIGNYVGEGFVRGMASYEGESAKAGMSLVMNAVKSASEIIEDGIDTTPVIRPVLDLSDIEDNAYKISELTGNIDSLSIGATSDMALQASRGFNLSRISSLEQTQSQMDILRNALNAIAGMDSGMTQNNTFNISGDNPRAIADEVSRVLQMQVERRGAVWA